MAELKDIMGYICHYYPNKDDLSKARLTKLVYLTDWKSVLVSDHQMTKIEWEFNHYGPYVDDVANVAYKDSDFNVLLTNNVYGSQKEVISLKKQFEFKSLTLEDTQILDHVIDNTKLLRWEEFLQLVYSTYPILINSKYSKLDLKHAAERYKHEYLEVI